MVSFQGLHHEEIKARIRIAYGSTQAFERRHGLVRKAVSDVLRGRPSARTSAAIEDFLNGKSPPDLA